ncbi:rhoptry neck protein 3, putative [Plasmodium gallinaceum]|uniref:Rhoptry neck protein 3, putative n=1 Tax=Plasmodium gallinaceum TaxID=5849 RepID=A0A1J1GXG6_PLAGA|nr:rhoptry neck protein 3, putative [Plasmodium gallinaceum]CRG97148.1 rhoptry neck protein 3, putative [Plasmodium gallinaceum]
MDKYLFYFSCIYLTLYVVICKQLENQNIVVFPQYSNLGNYFKGKDIQSKHNLNLSKGSKYNEYSLVSLKASSIFNQYYVARLINTLLYRGFKTFGNFHRNVAMYESLSRTNYFFYLTVLDRKNVKNIVKLLEKASNSKRKYEIFKKYLISQFDYPAFEINDAIKNEMDQALIVYRKAKTDSYWSLVDAVKGDGMLLIKTFFTVSFVQSLRGVIGVISHELLDVCFANAAVFNHIASFDRLFMNNTFGAIVGYVFKSFLLFFYPLIIPFRGAFAFVISAICVTQLSKIIFAIYRKLKQLYRISYRKITSVIYKVDLNKSPKLYKYSMRLLYGDALILVAKIWKLSYININGHLSGENIYPVLNNLFEKNLGTGFFDFSQSLCKYVLEALEDLKFIDRKDNDISENFTHKNKTFKTTLLLLKITRKALYYEEPYLKLAVANLLTKFYTLILVNIDHISRMNPKEHFYNDIESEFKYIYREQQNELFLQKLASDIIRKPFIKRNITRINKGCIELTLAIIKIKLFHYKPMLKGPYSSLYFDKSLKKQLDTSIKLIINGSVGIISSLANYGEKYNILKKCPFEIIKNLDESCDYTTYEVKKMLFPIKIFINILIPLFLNYKDVLIDKKIVNDIVIFFKVIIDIKEIHLYEYMKKIINMLKKEKGEDAKDIIYVEEIEKIVIEESNKVIDEINSDKRNSFVFQDYSINDGTIYLHNKDGNQFKFEFRDDHIKDNFLRLMLEHDPQNPFKYQVPQIIFDPSDSNNGSLIVGSSDNTFEGKIIPSYMHISEDDDNLVVEAIHGVLWSSGMDQFNAHIFSSMIGSVKQTFHRASSWKRAILNMVPTEFYDTHRRLMEKTYQEKDQKQNVFIKRIKKYRFQFNRESFSFMFRTFLENVLNKINFYDAEEAMIILVMSALYSVYKNIEKYKMPLNETYKLYQQKLVESYYHVSKYSHNYETYTINLIKKMNQDNEKLEKIKNVSEVKLSLDDDIVRNTKYLQLEIQSREKEKSDILKYITSRYGEIPHYEHYLHLPAQCLFLLYFSYESFLRNNIYGIEDVVNLLRKRNVIKKSIRNMNIIQGDNTKFSSITHKDLIQILCSTHLFLKKENVSLDDIYKDENLDNVIHHLLIIVSLLRIEKKTDRYSWKKYLTIEKSLDQRKKLYKAPLRYLYLKLLKVQRFFASMRRRVLLTIGKRMKKKRLINILRPTRFFEIIENAEVINESYPRAYIKFEDILIFSNVFHKFRSSILRYTKDKQSIREIVNNFKLAPNTSKNNEQLLLKIFENLNFLIKKKLKINLHNLRINKEDLEKYIENKDSYLLNEVNLNQELEEYLTQLIGFIKLLTDMNFTNQLFLRNFYNFIKLYALTGDLSYSINISSIYLCSKNYLYFILNSIEEFENFKIFIEKLKEKHDFKRYHLDPYNFNIQCHSTDNIKTYKILLNDLIKLNKYANIIQTELPKFYKDYLIFNLFYDNIDIENLNLIYDRMRKTNQSHVPSQENIYLSGPKNFSQNISFDDIDKLNESFKNYLYLEKFLENTNIPSIPFENFMLTNENNRVFLQFTNKATTPLIYKENILDQFTIVGRSMVSEYNNKVKCSFVNYPSNLYYWLVLNPGKPNIEAISKTGLIKEEDLKPKPEHIEDEDEIKTDEENILDNLFFDPNKEKSSDDINSDASTSAEDDSKNSEPELTTDDLEKDLSEKVMPKTHEDKVVKDNINTNENDNLYNLNTQYVVTESLNDSKNIDNSTDASSKEIEETTDDKSSEQITNPYLFLEIKHNEHIENNHKLNTENKQINFLEATKTDRLPFNSTMIINKNKKIVNNNYGFFNRPYNIYVPDHGIFRNFHMVMKLIQTLISMNKFSVISADSIIRKGIERMRKKNDKNLAQILNPFIHKMLLDINLTIQKLKSNSEMEYRGPNTTILSLYKLIEFQLFNQYLVYPPIKRLNEKELKYVLDIINEGYYFYIQKLSTKLRKNNINKDKILKFFSYFDEFKNILDEEGITGLHDLFINSLTCKNIKCFDHIFNIYIVEYYNRNVTKLLNNENLINMYTKFILDENALDVLQDAHDIYYITNKKNRSSIRKEDSTESLYNPQLSRREFLFSLLTFGEKYEPLHDMFNLFNIRHIYINISYMLLSKKYRIKRSLKIFSHKYRISNFLKTIKRDNVYIP